ncbi:MAG: 16S rRNA (uracil(1498)-N(3))-methyltransferase [Desulfobulbaceae bacterium]|nr:16S rRNA (uracil(1498)-N(3))-methyltransferase [Desulfobulbaceae bacterium]
MHRFFIKQKDIDGPLARLSGEEAHHLRTVRLKPGEKVELYDGTGNVYQAQIQSKDKAAQLIITGHTMLSRPAPELSIGQGLLKGKKMDFLLQKCTELGVKTFIPYTSRYCVVTPPKESKSDRWQKISMEACKQCGNPFPLDIKNTCLFEELLENTNQYATKLIFWEKETAGSIANFSTLSSTPSILALIGPEGGFSEEEVKMAVAAGFTSLSLGRRTLRAETATLSITSILQHLGGNL